MFKSLGNVLMNAEIGLLFIAMTASRSAYASTAARQ
jgi:hypothetical protein